MTTIQPKCTLCDQAAITTVAQFLVCAEHWQAYADEAGRDLPMHERPVFLALFNTQLTGTVEPIEIPLEQFGVIPLGAPCFWSRRMYDVTLITEPE